MKKSNATKSIVIVDDDVFILELLKFLLKDYEVVCFNNPISAYDYIMMNNTDVIISDIEMPNKSGIDMINDLKNKNIKIKKVIFMSSNIKEYIDFININKFLFIDKPISKELLFEYLKI